jgi:hypothetical protein
MPDMGLADFFGPPRNLNHPRISVNGWHSTACRCRVGLLRALETLQLITEQLIDSAVFRLAGRKVVVVQSPWQG